MSIRSFPELKSALAANRAALVEHSLYESITALRDVRVFMEHHVFAVWDFMSLLVGCNLPRPNQQVMHSNTVKTFAILHFCPSIGPPQ